MLRDSGTSQDKLEEGTHPTHRRRPHCLSSCLAAVPASCSELRTPMERLRAAMANQPLQALPARRGQACPFDVDRGRQNPVSAVVSGWDCRTSLYNPKTASRRCNPQSRRAPNPIFPGPDDSDGKAAQAARRDASRVGRTDLPI